MLIKEKKSCLSASSMIRIKVRKFVELFVVCEASVLGESILILQSREC